MEKLKPVVGGQWIVFNQPDVLIPPRPNTPPDSDPSETADVFMQWKGTDACLDLNCDCGTSSHVDGLFAYYVRCPGCLSIYEMPHDLTARKINPATDGEYAGQFLQGEVE